MRSLAVLQELDPDTCTRTANYLQSRSTQQGSVVDLFSLLVSALLVQLGGGPDVFAKSPADWADRAAATLEQHRHADGGYAKSPGGTSGSTYTTFLVALALEVLQRPMPNPQLVVSFLRTRERNGGFVEIPQMKRAGTNPTAAAIGTLQILNALNESTRVAACDYLLKLRDPADGGLRANDRIPTADLLSTFTGCWTLSDLGAIDRIDGVRTLAYAKSLQSLEGGFHGGTWDTGTDVEYTFYGIGVLALFAGIGNGAHG
jgi:geranylgeranyl transferase type-2 subunit beta